VLQFTSRGARPTTTGARGQRRTISEAITILFCLRPSTFLTASNPVVRHADRGILLNARIYAINSGFGTRVVGVSRKINRTWPIEQSTVGFFIPSRLVTVNISFDRIDTHCEVLQFEPKFPGPGLRIAQGRSLQRACESLVWLGLIASWLLIGTQSSPGSYE
jgi:hypothetical protein